MQRKASSPTVIENVGSVPVDVQEGDTYQFACDVDTRSGKRHLRGSTLRVLSRTTNSSFGEISASGYNWECVTCHGTSMWATLEQCISRGIVILKGRSN